jgi:cytochrome c-type biogenesis protein CcmH/NrfG
MRLFAAVALLLPAAEPAPDRLALAADALDRGDTPTAVAHLSAHVRSAPDDAMTRAYLAELLFKSGRSAEAAAEYERFVAAAQPLTGPANAHRVHAHTRLMSLAAAAGDEYREGLHRGIGLLLLAERWDADPARRDAAATAETLSKAAAALREALAARPRDARASWYLSRVYARQGQPAAARAAARAARAAPPGGLTPAEADALSRAD